MARQIRIVIPHKNVRKSNLAQKVLHYKEDPDVTYYETSLPMLNGSKHLTLNFGNYVVIRSVKNFEIKDEKTQNVVYRTFKTSSDANSIQIADTFSLLNDFALTIAAFCGKPL
jgi:hypothetical protein